jgi:hypothetical protein
MTDASTSEADESQVRRNGHAIEHFERVARELVELEVLDGR